MSSKPNNAVPPEASAGEPVGAAGLLSDLKGTGGESSVMPDLGASGSAKKSKYKVHSQTLVIALVLTASGAALYTMRKQGMGAGVNFNPPKIEYNVDQTKRKASDAQQRKVLSDLERSQTQSQVPPEKIQKNPFELDSGSAVAHGGPSQDPEAMKRNADRVAADARTQMVNSALLSIEVGAIMAGNVPLARINGKIVREGEMVADVFMVKEIHDRSVDLEADGKIFTVNMSENAPGSGGHRPRPPMTPRR